jgi:hypothetical protein
MQHLNGLTTVIALTAALVSSAAVAGTTTRKAAALPIGTDVSNAYPGVTLSRHDYSEGLGHSVWPIKVKTCNWGDCSIAGPVHTYAMDFYKLNSFVECLELMKTEPPESTKCTGFFSVFNIQFASPTDFVEVEAHWRGDPPVMVAYDEADNLIAECRAPASCLTVVPLGITEHIGAIRITTTNRNIKRVVFGSAEHRVRGTHGLRRGQRGVGRRGAWVDRL